MKLYRVKVNGKVYEVELESVVETNGHIDAPVTDSVASAVTPTTSGEGNPFVAPIGGKVLDIKVSVGSSVKKGDILCVIEAMKLENEVTATNDGVIKEIKVSKGDTVANKDVLFIIG